MTLPVPLSLGSLFSRSRSQSREYERTPLIEKLDRFRPEQQRLRRKAATAKHWILDRIAWARQTHAQRALRLRDGSDTLVDEAETPAAEVKPNGHSRDNSLDWKEVSANEWCLGAEFVDTYATVPPRRRVRSSSRLNRTRSLSSSSVDSDPWKYHPFSPETWTFSERPVFSDDNARVRKMSIGERRPLGSVRSGGKRCPHERGHARSLSDSITVASIREALYSPQRRRASFSPVAPLEPLAETAELAKVDLTDDSDASSDTELHTPPPSDGYLSSPALSPTLEPSNPYTSPTIPAKELQLQPSNPYTSPLMPVKELQPPAIPPRPTRLQLAAAMPFLSTPPKSRPTTPTSDPSPTRLTPRPVLKLGTSRSFTFPLSERARAEELDNPVWSDPEDDKLRSRRRPGAQKRVRFAAAPRVTEIHCSVYTNEHEGGEAAGWR